MTYRLGICCSILLSYGTDRRVIAYCCAGVNHRRRLAGPGARPCEKRPARMAIHSGRSPCRQVMRSGEISTLRLPARISGLFEIAGIEGFDAAPRGLSGDVAASKAHGLFKAGIADAGITVGKGPVQRLFGKMIA